MLHYRLSYQPTSRQREGGEPATKATEPQGPTG